MDKQYSYEHFMHWMQNRLGDTPCIRDKGAIARLKRADRPEQAPQAWDVLVRLNIPANAFAPCLLVGAAMCRRGDATDGKASLGLALAACYDDKNREQGERRLRRILSCTCSEELLSILRPILRFIDSRTKQKLCYARLLDEIVKFDNPNLQERFKLSWTQDFWHVTEGDEANT